MITRRILALLAFLVVIEAHAEQPCAYVIELAQIRDSGIMSQSYFTSELRKECSRYEVEKRKQRGGGLEFAKIKIGGSGASSNRNYSELCSENGEVKNAQGEYEWYVDGLHSSVTKLYRNCLEFHKKTGISLNIKDIDASNLRFDLIYKADGGKPIKLLVDKDDVLSCDVNSINGSKIDAVENEKIISIAQNTNWVFNCKRDSNEKRFLSFSWAEYSRESATIIWPDMTPEIVKLRKDLEGALDNLDKVKKFEPLSDSFFVAEVKNSVYPPNDNLNGHYAFFSVEGIERLFRDKSQIRLIGIKVAGDRTRAGIIEVNRFMPPKEGNINYHAGWFVDKDGGRGSKADDWGIDGKDVEGNQETLFIFRPKVLNLRHK